VVIDAGSLFTSIHERRYVMLNRLRGLVSLGVVLSIADSGIAQQLDSTVAPAVPPARSLLDAVLAEPDPPGLEAEFSAFRAAISSLESEISSGANAENARLALAWVHSSAKAAAVKSGKLRFRAPPGKIAQYEVMLSALDEALK
jgi:hypothetical protein